MVNTGLYLINPNLIEFIPDDSAFDMPDLLEIMLQKEMKIGVFTVDEESWIDVGQWGEYKKLWRSLIERFSFSDWVRLNW